MMIPLAIWKAHSHQVAAHGGIMISLFTGALLVVGLLATMPGLLMYKVIFGG